MKKLLLLFVSILLFTFTGELSIQGQNLTSPTNPTYYSLWKSYVPYVTYIRPDSVTMDASRFIFTSADTLQSFSQAGRPNPITPTHARWLWFYEFNSSLQLCDSAVIVCKLSLQIAPIGVETYLMVSFYDKNAGSAYFGGGKILPNDHSLVRYIWVISKHDQQVVGDGITTMSMAIQMGNGNPIMSPSVYVLNTVDMSDLKLYRDGKVIFHETFQPLITAVPRGISIPTGFILEQNYPNPFNPTTILRFSIPESGNYTLKVYNLLGQEIETLIDAYLAPGIQEYSFDGTNLPSGTYFYRLTGNSISLSNKMMLIK